jgi:hypothetical protein
MSGLAVVFVSYLKVPESRLREHFKWNDELYKAHGGLRVYVVSDVEHGLPDYAETVVVPLIEMPTVDGQPRFSLCKTKNAGIAAAIAGGASVIICTDVDIAFDWNSIGLTFAVDRKTAAIPVYRMAESFPARGEGQLDRGCTGTVGMTADNWRQIQFDERCVGYGADDGILLRDIERAGIEIIRDCEVAHIAHVQGDGVRAPGRGSDTCWGRDDGFNFDNFANNRRLHNGRVRWRRSRR